VRGAISVLAGASLTKAYRNVAELFKTPGKLRGKTPRTARKAPPSTLRMVRLETDAPRRVAR
jgi:hypothetical protein